MNYEKRLKQELKKIKTKKDIILFSSLVFNYMKKPNDRIKMPYLYDLAAVIKGFKPVKILDIEVFDGLKSKKIFKNIRYIKPKKYKKVVILWNNIKNDNIAILLYLHYYNIDNNSLRYNFYGLKSFHYITGKLLGYKYKEIKEYYILIFYLKKNDNNIKNIIDDISKIITKINHYHKSKANSSKKKLLKEKITQLNKKKVELNEKKNEMLKNKRIKSKNLIDFKEFNKNFNKFAKECDKLIEQILNNKEFIDKYKHLIKIL